MTMEVREGAPQQRRQVTRADGGDCRLEFDRIIGLKPVARVETGAAPATQMDEATLGALCEEAAQAGAASIVARSEALATGRIGALPVWEAQGFEKVFVHSLGRPLAVREPLGNEPPAAGMTAARLERYRAAVEVALDGPVQLNEPLVEQPYIHSFDLVSPSLAAEAPDLVCYAHFHPLTAAVYCEKIELAPHLRNRGIGGRIVEALLALAEDAGAGYVYLVALPAAERFWRRHAFVPLVRLNLRARVRSRDALRRSPGWERAHFGPVRLEQPVWAYRNHPGDDLDFLRALALYGERAGTFSRG